MYGRSDERRSCSTKRAGTTMYRPAPPVDRHGEGTPVALTDEAIARLRAMIQNGELPPGSRLPTENQLAAQMGLSRSGVREAVKVLEAARVLDVRRGNGTYVTSLAPHLL